MPETWVIFITENDIYGEGFPLYHVERIIEELQRPFDDGTHILYVNGANRDDTPLGTSGQRRPLVCILRI